MGNQSLLLLGFQLLIWFDLLCFFLAERRKEEDYDEEVEEDLQDEVSVPYFSCS